ncbi:hypothetical protein DYB25_006911 [Aphanomyces astaci]|uniref:Alpha-ketoglutarate-dependent dioxygenase AlkB-like domain-containing protein n=2 Tax=Aphanomyces astaci TaxID=112090 RepID=A0A397FVQ5_APHAT|nr:hypothetical protein DYB25_006911 [Aphanomyces astaci]RHY45894.1 hypothetical protein DYB30_001736 [Aphanomyces astaci]RHY66066.1 hypothetical protein DYB38_007382 [Aphanomyces astaci]RHZ29971.1 hypothetical protein DYB26_004250 [Aphanomyces astaci]RHZ41636.1 hypothetical protein DYB31_004123 [Aphanomyces astaci]
MLAQTAPSDQVPRVDHFRPIEKYYRRRGDGHKNSKQRRRERHQNTDGGVDYSDVIDVHCLERNTEAQRIRIRCVPLSPHGTSIPGAILSPKHAEMFEIDGLPGLCILINAMPRSTQVEWAFRAVREYSQNPFTNVSNLTKERDATKNMWKHAWKEPCEASWKAFHALRWANVGRHYDWTEREYLDTPDMPPLPLELEQLVHEVFEMTGMLATCKAAESGIVNFYPAGTMMGGHLDNAEDDMVNPIVSLSLGTQCIYLQGGLTRETPPTPLWLCSGIAIVTSMMVASTAQL